MAVKTKDSLLLTLNRVIKADKTLRVASESAQQDLIDSVYGTITSDIVSLGATSTAIPALTVPANCIILDAGVIVTTAIAMSSGKVGTKIGTAADGVELSAANDDTIATTGVAVAAGIGTNTTVHTQAALGGFEKILIVAGQAYRSAETEVHFTITSTAAATAGAVKCFVRYQELA